MYISWDLTLFYSVSFYFVSFSCTAQIHKLKFKSEYYLRINMWNCVKMQTPAITHWFSEQCLLGFFIFEKHHGVNPVGNDCMYLQPYSHDSFSKILRVFFASRNWWIILVFLQRTLKENLPFVLINTLLLHIFLLAFTDRGTELQTEEHTRYAWAGGTFFSVVILCQFLVLVGNRFWFYILFVLRVQYSCGVLLVFWFWWEIVISVTYVLSVQTVVR